VQAGAGVRWHVSQGDPVRSGQSLATLYTDTPERFPAAMADLADAITVGDPGQQAQRLPLLVDRVGR
jgi:thymidine phosphorylase